MLQQLLPEHYRAFKTRMLHTALTQAGYSAGEANMHFIGPASRRRAEFRLARVNNGVALAFLEPRSHTQVPIESCLILEPALQSLLAPMNEALSALPQNNAIKSISLTAADSGIDVLFTLRQEMQAGLPRLMDSLPLQRLSLRLPDGSIRILQEKTPVEMMLGGYGIALPPGAFLQATREGQERLTQAVCETAKGHTNVIDLFCGIGTYSFPLSQAATVHAAEGDAAMVKALQTAIKCHGVSRLSATRRDLFTSPYQATELTSYSLAVINPPRLGAKAQCLQLAESGVKTVVMVSCNPATFARDARILKNGGFTLFSAHGIDQFTWSPHLEIVAVFTRITG